jgi:energy-coupling factor transporter ATP-binding protein EcfA2
MTFPVPPAILIHDLHYAYPSPVHGGAAVQVLRGVNLQVGRGEFVALLGRVGAGKTTLCMALNGLVPHATGGSFRGDVMVLGRNTKQHPVADLARSVGLVFQDPETQLTQMRVEDEIAFGLENLGVPSEEIEARVTWALNAVGLADYRDRSPLRLSGGEKQRVAIASMLAMRPQVLVLDEPTANLDPAGKAELFNLLARLARERQMTILLASQELERVARYADRILALQDGQIGLDGPPAEVFSQVARLQEWGVGVPQLAELAHLLARQTGRPFNFIRMGQAYTQLRAEQSAMSSSKNNLRTSAGRAPTPDALAVLPEEPPPLVGTHTWTGALPESAGQADGREVPASVTPGVRNAGSPQSQIVLEGVSFSYPDGTPALRDVNLTVGTGEFVALLGPNGSGKTTLAKHLNGLLKPARGHVLLDGRETRAARVAELARQVGYVFQNPDHQIFAATVGEEVAFGLRLQGMSPSSVAERVSEVLAAFGLDAQLDLPPALLGWGQRRRMALAAVLATQPRILILDEPTGGLDHRSRQELMATVAAFNRAGRTVILITHDMRLVAECASRAVVLAGGRVDFDDTPRALFDHRSILARARLAMPPVVRLAQRMAAQGLAPGVMTCADFAVAWQALLERDPGDFGRLREDAVRASDAGTSEVSGQGGGSDGI